MRERRRTPVLSTEQSRKAALTTECANKVRRAQTVTGGVRDGRGTDGVRRRLITFKMTGMDGDGRLGSGVDIPHIMRAVLELSYGVCRVGYDVLCVGGVWAR
jgi:hypothetical protein